MSNDNSFLNDIRYCLSAEICHISKIPQFRKNLREDIKETILCSFISATTNASVVNLFPTVDLDIMATVGGNSSRERERNDFFVNYPKNSQLTSTPPTICLHILMPKALVLEKFGVITMIHQVRHICLLTSGPFAKILHWCLTTTKTPSDVESSVMLESRFLTMMGILMTTLEIYVPMYWNRYLRLPLNEKF